MKAFFTLLIILILPLDIFCQITGNQLIFPDPENPIMIAFAEPTQNENLKARIADQDNPLIYNILSELKLPFHMQMIRVNQCIRNYSGNDDGPNLLVLSENEGGFPRTGIALASGTDSGYTDYPNLHFVDLVIDQDRFDQGDLFIYTHELGHVMMELMMPTYWDRFSSPMSPKQHVSMGITDYLTAFYEGWGIQFQRLAYNAIEKYEDTFIDKMDIGRGLTMAWHSNLDEYLRLFHVIDNYYIYNKTPASPDILDTLTMEEKILYDHTSPNFDLSSIKNGQQLLSSEGFAATFFFLLISNEKLSNSYEKPEFYRPFLLKTAGSLPEPSRIFSPIENTLLKIAYIWHLLEISDTVDPPLTSFVTLWANTFPADAETIIKTFILVSRGRTVSDKSASLAEKTNLAGQMGDIQQFRNLSQQYFRQIKKDIDMVLADVSLLDSNVGPEIWVTHPALKIRRTLWFEEPVAEFKINLNTASEPEIEAFIGSDDAPRFIKVRKEIGFFNNLEQIRQLGFRF